MSSTSSNGRAQADPESYLKGSIQIPRNSWGKLPENSEISYYRTDGKFVRKCFVKAFYEKNGQQYMLCSNKLYRTPGDKYYSEFRLKLQNIKDIYKRVSGDSVIEYKLIKIKLDKEISTLKDLVSSLNARLEKEEESSRKIIKLIKHLHNIKSLDELKNI